MCPIAAPTHTPMITIRTIEGGILLEYKDDTPRCEIEESLATEFNCPVTYIHLLMEAGPLDKGAATLDPQCMYTVWIEEPVTVRYKEFMFDYCTQPTTVLDPDNRVTETILYGVTVQCVALRGGYLLCMSLWHDTENNRWLPWPTSWENNRRCTTCRAEDMHYNCPLRDSYVRIRGGVWYDCLEDALLHHPERERLSVELKNDYQGLIRQFVTMWRDDAVYRDKTENVATYDDTIFEFGDIVDGVFVCECIGTVYSENQRHVEQEEE